MLTLARKASNPIIHTNRSESLSLFACVSLWSAERLARGSSCSERCCAVSDNQSGPPAFPPHPPDWSRPCEINHRTHVHLSTALGIEMCVYENTSHTENILYLGMHQYGLFWPLQITIYWSVWEKKKTKWKTAFYLKKNSCKYENNIITTVKLM